MGQVFYGTDPWPTWPIHICWSTWPMTHDPLIYCLLWSVKHMNCYIHLAYGYFCYVVMAYTGYFCSVLLFYVEVRLIWNKKCVWLWLPLAHYVLKFAYISPKLLSYFLAHRRSSMLLLVLRLERVKLIRPRHALAEGTTVAACRPTWTRNLPLMWSPPWHHTLLTRRHPACRCNLAPSSPVDILVRPGGSGNATTYDRRPSFYRLGTSCIEQSASIRHRLHIFCRFKTYLFSLSFRARNSSLLTL